MKHLHCCGFNPPRDVVLPHIAEVIDTQPEAGCGHVWEDDDTLPSDPATLVEVVPGWTANHHCPVCKRGPWLLQFKRCPLLCSVVKRVEKTDE